MSASYQKPHIKNEVAALPATARFHPPAVMAIRTALVEHFQSYVCCAEAATAVGGSSYHLLAHKGHSDTQLVAATFLLETALPTEWHELRPSLPASL